MKRSGAALRSKNTAQRTPSMGARLIHRLVQQKLPHKHNRRVELEIAVLLLDVTVSLIGGGKEPYRSAGSPDLVQDLDRLAVRHARIVLAYHSEQGLADRVSVVRRRNARQVFSHLGVPFVSVLRPAQITPIRLGMFQKGDQI